MIFYFDILNISKYTYESQLQQTSQNWKLITCDLKSIVVVIDSKKLLNFPQKWSN
jgi:hypothetical protein